MVEPTQSSDVVIESQHNRHRVVCASPPSPNTVSMKPHKIQKILAQLKSTKEVCTSYVASPFSSETRLQRVCDSKVFKLVKPTALLDML